jgi:hypothetical protein
VDAKHAAARGFVDAVITPEQTRDALELALRVSASYDGRISAISSCRRRWSEEKAFRAVVPGRTIFRATVFIL